MSVRSDQRHKRHRPCLICGGGDNDLRGIEKRCHGFLSDNEEWEHCSREEHAGMLSLESGSETYAHRLHGPCRCGVQHGEARSGTSTSQDFLATYDYRDERDNLLFQVVRLNRPTKEFRQRRPDGQGWVWKTSDCRKVLYRLPQLLAASPTKPVYVVEGEKDVESLERLGLVATCNPGGAGKWAYVAEEARRLLAGRDVVVIADADEAGRLHAATVAHGLEGYAKSVRLVEPPPPHKDVTDYIGAGGDVSKLGVSKPAHSFQVQWAPSLAQPLPPVKWLCEGYSIPSGAYCLVAGESYSGKSFWVMDLAMAIASGRDALGLYRAKQGRVLWLDYDGQGERITRSRLQRMSRVYGYDLADLGENFGYVWLPTARLDDADAVEKFVPLLDGISFVVIDSWRGACPNTEERDRAAVQKVGEAVLRIMERTGCTPMMVDHTTKPPREQARAEQRSAIHDIHGSTAKAEMAQWVAMFQKTEDKPVKVLHKKERAANKLMSPFWLRYDNVSRGDDPEWGLRVSHLDEEQITESGGDFEDKKEAVIRAFKRRKRPMSANDVVAMVTGRKATVLLAIKDLLDEGRVVDTGLSAGQGGSTLLDLDRNHDRMPPRVA